MSDEKMTSNNVEAEYKDIGKRSAWPFVYQKLGRESQAFGYTTVEAKKPQNKPLNRYRDVNPYDHSRVILKRSEVDYINANFVTMERAKRNYILTQGPLSSTVNHFWLMVWEQQSRAILMLNKIVEKNELKCHQYWPDENATMDLTEVGLTVQLIKSEENDHYCTRWFKLTDTESQMSREVVQFHYTTWPDFGVPTSPVAFLKFLKLVRDSGALEADVGPAVVHCSAGIGRSGTFCLVDSCLVIIENEGVDSVKVQEILLELRKGRMGLIQTPDQLRFSYQAIIEGARRLDPNYDEAEAEDLYSCVPDEDVAPPLPPRGASLLEQLPPARPLPAIPASASAGDLILADDSLSSSESERSPSPPNQSSPSPPNSDEEDNLNPPNESPGVRQRRKTEELQERVTAMKRRQRNAEWWRDVKRLKSMGKTKENEQKDG